MTLSLSPFVFLCFCVFVLPCFRVFMFSFFPFFSFSVPGVCSAFFLVLKCFNSVSRKFKGCLKFKEVSRMFQGCFQSVCRKFKGCFKEVSRVVGDD